jgi:hypothetical protein
MGERFSPATLRGKKLPVVESTDMELTKPDLLPAPPKIISALTSGFDAIANHISLILLPALLDMFFWLGPQLKADSLLAPMFELAAQNPANEQLKPLMDTLTEAAKGLSLFSSLRSYPVGIFSLMAGNLSLTTPLGQRLQIDPGSLPASFALILGLTLAGWIGGSLYFRAVASLVVKEKAPPFLRAIVQSFLLSGLWMVFFAMAYMPIVLVFLLAQSLLNETILFFLMLLVSIPLSWFLIGVYYSSYGVFMEAHNAFRSVWNSFRVVRYSLPNLGWFSIVVIVLSYGMDLLWRIPPATSWMTLVGILGHAFVSTSLLAASFFYFRDLSTWIGIALEWLKTKNKSSAQG